jgi:hypothetical protein
VWEYALGVLDTTMRAYALRNMQGRAQELRCKDEHKSAPTRHLLPPHHHTMADETGRR